MRRNLSIFGLALALVFGPTVAVQAKPVEESFYKAYYLEREKGDLNAAAKLYGEVAAAGGAEAGIKAEAKVRLASVREELASADFAQLMPPDALVYVEFSRPGEQIGRLLDMLGLLAGPNQLKPEVSEGLGKAMGGKHVAVSPALIKGLLGVRGAAIAVTGFDPAAQMPSGVAILHPGDLDLVRGIIESGLPAGAEAVKPIEGFPTYQIKEANNLVICVTSRLVIVSPQRPQIVAVIKRMNGEGDSLAGNTALAEVLADRKDAMIFYCVNAKPIVPMVKSFAGVSQELAMASAVLDIDKLSWISGRWGVGEHGLFSETAVGFDKGHHNLAYNMLRTPPVTKETLKCIPKGAAGFLAAALGNPGGPIGAKAKSEGQPTITGLDFGREIFANIVDFAVFGIPPASDGRSEGDGAPMPDVAAVIRVNDPAKSEALWTQILGIASLGAGAPTTDGKVEEMGGASVRTYQFPEGIKVYFASVDDKVLVSGSRYAMTKAVEAARGGDSIVSDEAFAASLGRITEHTSKALFAHPGRCFQMARKFMDEGDIKEAEPVIGLMTHTVASILTNEAEEKFQISASLTGLPKVGGLIAHLIQEEDRERSMQDSLRQAVREKKWDEALTTLDGIIASGDATAARYQKKFEILATGKQDRDAALAVANVILEKYGKNATALNEFAWALLTEEKYDGKYADLALKLAQKGCELTGHKNWMIVDTLARAKFETGDVAAAIELQKKAIELEGGEREDVKEALAKYEAAKKGEPTAAATP